MKRYFEQSLIYLIPFLIIVVGLLLMSTYPLRYTSHTDPEYFYLLNGLDFAQFKIISGNYFHPGVPLQILCGIIVKVVYVFGGKHSDIAVDVMSRPEFYVSAINGVIIVLTAVVFYFAGKRILTITENVWIAVFIQTAVFSAHISFLQMTFLGAENLIFPLTILLFALCIEYIYKPQLSKYFIYKISFVIAACVLQKFSMLPFVVLPLFIFPKSEFKKYVLVLSGFLLVLSIPILTSVVKMAAFLGNMLMHSGLYGSGSVGIIDWSSLWPNVQLLYLDHTFAFVSFVSMVLFAILIASVLPTKNNESVKYKKLIFAVAVIEFVIFLMVLKHFKSHYFTPVIAFSMFNFYLIIGYLITNFSLRFKWMFLFMMPVLVLSAKLNYNPIKSLFIWYDARKSLDLKVLEIQDEYKEMPKIILPRYYGTPFVEFSLHSAMFYTNNKSQYGAIGKSLFPNSYIYNAEWGMYDMSYQQVVTADVLNRYPEIIVSYYFSDDAFKQFTAEVDSVLKDGYQFRQLFYDEKSEIVVAKITKSKYLGL